MHRPNLLALAAALTLASSPASAADQGVVIRFSGKAGSEPLNCGRTYGGIGATGADITLQDFRAYVSNLRLIDEAGREVSLRLTDDGVWQGDGVVLLDLEDASGSCNGNTGVNTTVIGHVPAGRYRGLAFDLGVPLALNHQDTTRANPPLNFSALSWPWRGGYKFVTIDFDARSSEHPTASGFSIHLGSTDCGAGSPVTPPSSPCQRQNRPTYRFERFDPARQTIVLDLAALVAETDVTRNAPQTPAGCMSGQNDDDCVGVMSRFGLAFRQSAAKPQSWVRVE